MWCPQCQETWKAINEDAGKIKGPPCEQCRPQIDPLNLEAWEVFQMVSNDASGVTSQGIQAACQILEVSDPKECYIKVVELTKRIRMLTEPIKPVEEK